MLHERYSWCEGEGAIDDQPVPGGASRTPVPQGLAGRRGRVATAIKAVTEPLIARHKELVGKDPPG